MKENCLIIVAKQPLEGHCKTRLAKTIGHAAATALYETFLLDIRNRLIRGLVEDYDVIVAYTPESDPAFFESFCPFGWKQVPQRGAHFGERLYHAIADALDLGYKRVVLMSSDSPDLPDAYIYSAFNRLQDHDAVMGPCEDGGYYLIGMRRKLAHLFHEITWSTEVVAEQTMNRAKECGAVLALLPHWYDIDGVNDLQRLIKLAIHRDSLPPGASLPAPIPSILQLIKRELAIVKSLNVEEGALQPSMQTEISPEPASYSDMRWQRTATKLIYQNPWMDIHVDDVLLPDKRETKYGVVTFGECIGVLPVLHSGHILLVRQYRHAQGDFYWEMPTGRVEGTESPIEAASRELREETGYSASSLIPIQSFHTSKSICRETAHLFVGIGIARAPLPPDENEFIRVESFPIQTVLDMVKRGLIMDSMTIVAIYAVASQMKLGDIPSVNYG